MSMIKYVPYPTNQFLALNFFAASYCMLAILLKKKGDKIENFNLFDLAKIVIFSLIQ